MDPGTETTTAKDRLRTRIGVLLRRLRSVLPAWLLLLPSTVPAWVRAHPRWTSGIAAGVVVVAGTLAWLIVRAPGPPLPAGRTPLEIQGERVFWREGCYYGCHQAGTKLPGGSLQANLAGKVRWAPDLTKAPHRSDDWQLEHLISPRSVTVGSYMPSYAHLTKPDLQALVAYLQSLKRDIPTPTPQTILAADIPVIPLDLPSYNEGRKVYQTYCVACHGQGGVGNGPGSEALLPEPRDFTDEAWMSKQSDVYLFSVITNGKANTAMPSYGGILSPQQRALVLSYIKYFADPITKARMEQGFSAD